MTHRRGGDEHPGRHRGNRPRPWPRPRVAHARARRRLGGRGRRRPPRRRHPHRARPDPLRRRGRRRPSRRTVGGVDDRRPGHGRRPTSPSVSAFATPGRARLPPHPGRRRQDGVVGIVSMRDLHARSPRIEPVDPPGPHRGAQGPGRRDRRRDRRSATSAATRASTTTASTRPSSSPRRARSRTSGTCSSRASCPTRRRAGRVPRARSGPLRALPPIVAAAAPGHRRGRRAASCPLDGLRTAVSLVARRPRASSRRSTSTAAELRADALRVCAVDPHDAHRAVPPAARARARSTRTPTSATPPTTST